MEYVLLGWPPDGPRLRLHYEAFSYAGKFVMTNTGKAVAHEGAVTGDGAVATDDEGYATGVAGAISFDADRTDATTLRLRYVTVRADRRGQGIGPRLAAFVASRARDRGYEDVKIAVNNPFAYEALHKAGFGYTGEETGLAELVLSDTAARTAATYRAGLDAFRARDVTGAEVAFLAEREGADPPPTVDPPPNA